MSDKPPLSSDSLSEGSNVSVELEASSLLRVLATPAVPGERVAAAIARAAHRAGLTFQRTRSLWYQEARAILAVEMDELRKAAASARQGSSEKLRARDEALGDRVALIELELAALRVRLARPLDAGEVGEGSSGRRPLQTDGGSLRGPG